MNDRRGRTSDAASVRAALAICIALLVVVMSFAVGETSAFFTDAHPGGISGLTLLRPSGSPPPSGSPAPSPTPAVPAECGNVGYKSIVYGTDNDDMLDAGNGKTVVFGLGGDDTLTSGTGKDCLIGGTGNDFLESDNGPDVLIGGPGDDVLIGGNGPELIDGGDGFDVCVKGRGPATFINCESSVLPASAPPAHRGEPSTQPTDESTVTKSSDASTAPTPAPTDVPLPSDDPSASASPY